VGDWFRSGFSGSAKDKSNSGLERYEKKTIKFQPTEKGTGANVIIKMMRAPQATHRRPFPKPTSGSAIGG
jgi:hypothetical protein